MNCSVFKYSRCYRHRQIYQNDQCVDYTGQDYDLNLLNMQILRSIAEKIGLEKYSRLRKHALIAELGKYNLRNLQEKYMLSQFLKKMNISNIRIFNNISIDENLQKLLYDPYFKDNERILTFSYKIIYPNRLSDNDMGKLIAYVKKLLT